MKRSDKNFEFYVFDLYGTLVDIHTDEKKAEVWEKLSLFYGYYGAEYRAKELQCRYLQIINGMVEGAKDGERDSHEAFPEIQIEDVFQRLYQEKGIDTNRLLGIYTGQFFRILAIEYIRLYDGVKELLEVISRRGKKIYLLSNAQRIFAEYEMKLLGIHHYFDQIFISSDYGYKKPDSRFFEELFHINGFRKEKAVMIGNDGICDIEGAQKAGLWTCYVHSNISPEEETPRADYVVEGADGRCIMEILFRAIA